MAIATSSCIKYLSSSEIAQWIEMFVSHINDSYTEENVKLKALAYEYKLTQKYGAVTGISYNLDPLFIVSYNNDKFKYKNLLDKMILFSSMLESGFPLLGSIIDCYNSIMREVTLYGSPR